jgi:hypothetical protein
MIDSDLSKTITPKHEEMESTNFGPVCIFTRKTGIMSLGKGSDNSGNRLKLPS